MTNIVVLSWLCILGACSMGYSLMNAYYMKPFWRFRNSRYIVSRKPSLLIVYGILSSLVLFAVVPNICVSISTMSLRRQSADITTRTRHWTDLYYFIFDAIFEATFATLIVIIAARAWLLFYDYRFTIAQLDRVWLRALNPSHQNFFLNHRTTIGNSHFILKLVAVIWLLLLFAITVTALVFNTGSISASLHSVWPLVRIDQILFFVVKIVIGFVVLIFVFVLHHKIQQINDQFNIRNEVKYLSFMVLFVIWTSVVALLLLQFTSIPLYEFQTIVYTFDVLFICSSCYVQFKWMLKHLIFHIKSDTLPVKMPLSMAQVLCEKDSFEAFMRHCVDELSVESLLFLVEIAQYKATLTSYNASDKQSTFLSLNMKSTNFRELLLKNRHQSGEVESIGSKSSPFASSPIPHERSIKLLFQNPREDCTSPKQRRKTSDASTDVSQFRQFQRSILERKWLPLSTHLHVLSIQRHVHKSALHQSMLGKGGSLKTRSLRDLSRVELSNELSSPYLEMVNDRSNSVRDQSNLQLASKRTLAAKIAKSKSTNSVAALSSTLKIGQLSNSKPAKSTPLSRHAITSEDIRCVAVFLYGKYIEANSDLCVNLAWDTRQCLDEFFALSSEQMFEYIITKSGGTEDKSPQCPAALDEKLLINTYLYHVFDTAFHEIWSLLRKDVFRRFVKSESYQKLVRLSQVDQQLEEEKEIEVVYSTNSSNE